MLMASRLGKMAVRLAAAALALALAAAAASPPLFVTSADISVAIDAASGTIIQLNTSAGFTTAVTAGFAAGELNGVPPMPTNTSVAACGTSVCVSRSVVVTGQLSNGSCCTTYQVDVNEVFAPVAPAIPGAAPSHIAWTVTIASSAAAAWRTTFNTSVTLAVTGANASDALYWVPRHGPTATPTIWDDVLRMLSAADSPTPRRTQYGHAMMFDDLDGREESAATLGVIVSRSAGGGVAVVQDPSDPLFGVTMNADPATISIARWYNRLGAASQPVSFTTALVPVTGLDWRPAFAWARIALPQFFLAPTLLSAAAHTPSVGINPTVPSPPPRHLIVGLGVYTCAGGDDLNATALASYGATHNWDAHFWWPYIGMLLPPQVVQEWASNIGDGEETDCGAHFTHGQTVNRSTIAASYEATLALANTTTLAYFNLVEFGENVAQPLPPRTAPGPNDWMNSSVFIANNLSDALWEGDETYTWQNAVLFDPAVSVWADFLLAQAQQKVDSFDGTPGFGGIAVDRMDHLTRWNMAPVPAVDPNVTWCGQPCYPLAVGWKALMARIAAIIYSGAHGGSRITTGNYYATARIDTLATMDGVFSEDVTTHLWLLNAAGLSTTAKPPAMIWTYTASEVSGYSPTPDAYFAQHALMKVAPMAPTLGNDHSIQPAQDPSGAVQRLYADWAPIFSAHAGGCWWLAASPAAVDAVAGNATVSVNAFTWGGGCTDVTVAGGNGPVLRVMLFAMDAGGGAGGPANVTLSMLPPDFGAGGSPPPVPSCEWTVPGAGMWLPSVPSWDAARSRWLLPPLTMKRGGLSVVCSPSAAAEALAA